MNGRILCCHVETQACKIYCKSFWVISYITLMLIPRFVCFLLLLYFKCSSFVINGSDKVLRVYNLEDLLAKLANRGDSDDDVEALQRLQDLVNRYDTK